MRDFSNNLADIIPIHSKPIRDVQCYRADPFANESLVLTASMDNYLKITSAKSQQVVLGYSISKKIIQTYCFKDMKHIGANLPFFFLCSKTKQLRSKGASLVVLLVNHQSVYGLLRQ